MHQEIILQIQQHGLELLYLMQLLLKLIPRYRGYYNEISKLLQAARDEYYSNPANLKDPERKIALLENELEKLKEEQQVIKEHNAELLPKYRYGNKLPYTDAVATALDKLKRDRDRIQARIDKIRAVAGLPAPQPVPVAKK
jgi:chromosome segregation ATPase